MIDGERYIPNGLYHDLPGFKYYRSDATSNSYLSRLGKCPAESQIVQPETNALRFGRALHCFVLEGKDQFDTETAIMPEINRRTNQGKAEAARFEIESLGKTIITREEAKTITEMNEAVRSHPFALSLLEAGQAEISCFWTDEKTGLQCKCRIDWRPDNYNGVIVDLKSTRDASPRGFTKSVADYGYAKQNAIYLHGYNQHMKTYDEHVSVFAFIAVETKPPYRTEVYTLDHAWVQAGFEEFETLIAIEKKCRSRNFWPNFTNIEPGELRMPGYLK